VVVYGLYDEIPQNFHISVYTCLSINQLTLKEFLHELDQTM